MKAFCTQNSNYPDWKYDLNLLIDKLISISKSQGFLLGKVDGYRNNIRNELLIEVLAKDIYCYLPYFQANRTAGLAKVKKVVAKHFNLITSNFTDDEEFVCLDHHLERIIELVLDAKNRNMAPITVDYLLNAHATLSSLKRNTFDDFFTPDFVNSPADQIDYKINLFLDFVNDQKLNLHVLLKSGIAFFWWLDLHSFEELNEKIGALIIEKILSSELFNDWILFSISSQILNNLADCRRIFEQTKQKHFDLTKWLNWFLSMVDAAIKESFTTFNFLIMKNNFWQKIQSIPMNERQIMVLNLLLDDKDFLLKEKKKIDVERWVSVTRCSLEDAQQDINELVAHHVLRKSGKNKKSNFVYSVDDIF